MPVQTRALARRPRPVHEASPVDRQNSSERRGVLSDKAGGVLDMFLRLLVGHFRLMEKKTLTATDIVDRYFQALEARDFPTVAHSLQTTFGSKDQSTASTGQTTS